VADIWYFLNTAISGTGLGDLQLNGTAPGASTAGTGWKVGKTGTSTPYGKMVFLTANSATFDTNANVGPVSTTAPGTTDSYRTGLLQQTYKSGTNNWSWKMAVISVGTGASGVGRISMKCWRSANADGSSATNVIVTEVAINSWSNLTTSTAQNCTNTTSLASDVTFNNEYLFFQTWCVITTASGSSTANVTLRIDGTNSKITPGVVVYDRTPSDSVAVTDTCTIEKINATSTETQTAGGNVLDVTFTSSDALVPATTAVWEKLQLVSGSATVVASDTKTDTTNTLDEFPRDAASVTDSLANQVEYARAPTDSASVTDGSTVERVREVSASDSVSVTDSATIDFFAGTHGTTYDATPSDSVNVSDSELTEVFFERAGSDSVAVSDSGATEASYERLLADSAGVSDTVLVERAREVAAGTDTVSVSDSAAAAMSFDRSLVDTAAPANTALWEKVRADGSVAASASTSDAGNTIDDFPVADAASASDAFARDLAFARELTDSASVADADTTEVFFERGISDSVSVSDSNANEAQYGRDVSDSVAVSDAIAAGKERDVFLSDAAGVSDSLTDDVYYERLLADSAGVSDSLTNEVLYARGLSDVVAVSDAGATEATYSRAAADIASIADSVLTELTIAVGLTDTITVSDSAAVDRTRGMDASDTVNVSDSGTTEMSFERLPSDTLAITEDLLVQVAGTTNIDLSPDAVSIVDALANEAQYARDLTDSASVSDSTSVGFVRATDASDSVTVSDSTTHEVTFERAGTDAAAVSDSARLELFLDVSSSDTVSVSDSTAPTATFERAGADAASATDSFAREASFDRARADTISIVDSTAAGKETHTDASDAVSASDAVLVEPIFDRTLSDSIATDDVIGLARWVSKNPIDVAAIADAVAVELLSPFIDITLDDALAITDVATPTLLLTERQFDISLFQNGEQTVVAIELDAVGHIHLATLTPQTEIALVAAETHMEIGDVARYTATFFFEGEALDPTIVMVQVLPPSGNGYVLTYPDDNLDRLDTGIYKLLIPCTESGRWRIRILATGGTTQAARQDHFDVAPLNPGFESLQ